MAKSTRLLALVVLFGGALFTAPAAAAGCEFNFSQSLYTRGEELGQAKILVTRSVECGNAAQTIRVTTTPSGFAENQPTPGVDYQDASQTLSFPASIDTTAGRNKFFLVTLIDDTIRDPNESIRMELSNPSSGAIGERSRATLTILDNESDRVQFASTEYHVSEHAGSVTLGLVRVGDTSQGGTINWSTGTSIGGTSASASAVNGSDYTHTFSTVTFAPNQTTASISVPILNDTRGEPDEEFAVQLEGGGIPRGNPSSAFVLIVDDGDTPPPRLQFAASSYSVSESAGTLTLTVRRTGDQTVPATYRYFITEDSAANGSDFTGPSTATGTDSTIPAGQTSSTITIPITNDATVEQNEFFLVQLIAPFPAELGTPDEAVVTITDDDAVQPEQIKFQSPAYTIAESGDAVTLTVTRMGPTTSARTVSFATSNGTATAGSDYTSATGSVGFAVGESTAIFEVPILSDTTEEQNETFSVTLSSPSGGATLVSPSVATVTITDDNLDSAVAFAAESYSVNEGAGSVELTVMRAGDTSTSGVFNYSTMDDTAMAGLDYVGTANSIEFDAGETSKTITVPIVDDESTEDMQTFSVALEAVSGSLTVAEPDSARVTILDNDEDEMVTHARTVTLVLKRHLRVTGGVSTQGPADCINFVPVEVQRRRSGIWTTVASGVTGADGSFVGRLRDKPGRYRAVAAAAVTADNELCGAAVSSVVRHRH